VLLATIKTMDYFLKTCITLITGLSIVSFSCAGPIILKKNNIKSYNKVFVGTIINEEKDESNKYMYNFGSKKIIIKIDEVFITDSIVNDTIELIVENDGYFQKKDKWLFILANDRTTYCMSLWMNAKSETHNDQVTKDAIQKNLKFLKKHTSKK
jgi:hypothetical protein